MNFGAVPRFRFDVYSTTNEQNALLHSQKSQAAAVDRALSGCFNLETGSIVSNRHLQLRTAPAKFDPHLGRLGMANDVGDRLLGNAEASSFEIRLGPNTGRVGAERRFESCPPGLAIEIPAQCRHKAEIVQ